MTNRFRRFAIVFGMVSLLAAIAVLDAGATITAPTVNVEPLAQGILTALSNNLNTILTAAGILAGVFFVLRMARRWFGARASA